MSSSRPAHRHPLERPRPSGTRTLARRRSNLRFALTMAAAIAIALLAIAGLALSSDVPAGTHVPVRTHALVVPPGV